MDQPTGELLVRWTVRLAVACYVVRLLHDVRRPATSMPRWLLGVWTAGCGLMMVHVLLAFGVYHHWSHAEAYASTARQTAELTGFDWGGGIYFNYVFVVFWLVDAVLNWLVPQRVTSSRYRLVLHIVFAFMMFNATFVFGPIVWKLVVPLVVVVALSRSYKSVPVGRG